MALLTVVVVLGYLAIAATYAARIPRAWGTGLSFLVGALIVTSGYALLAADKAVTKKKEDRRLKAIGFLLLAVFFAGSLNLHIAFYDGFAAVGYVLMVLGAMGVGSALTEAGALLLFAYCLLGFVYKVSSFELSETGHMFGRAVLAAYYATTFFLE